MAPGGALELQCAQTPPAAESWVEALGAPGKEGDRWVLRDAFTREQPEENGASAGKLPLLTSIAQVSKLSSKQAGQAYPVKVQGVVTAKFENGMNFVIQNAGLGIYVNMVPGNTRGPLEIGDLCEVVGITREATWAPSIAAQQVKALGIGRMPEPLRMIDDGIEVDPASGAAAEADDLPDFLSGDGEDDPADDEEDQHMVAAE